LFLSKKENPTNCWVLFFSYENIITGGSGFIGSHLVEKLMNDNQITVIDNFDPFYPREIKLNNIKSFNSNVKLIEMDIRNQEDLSKIEYHDVIIHLAAKAGVRPSIINPIEYQEVNIRGTLNLLEFAKNKKITQFIFASSSSVYGTDSNIPWNEDNTNLKPISPYAITKLSGEFFGHVYSSLFKIRFISLRFFTVFGPRQRPDLAISLFSKKIINNEIIELFGNGSTKRDYTYIDDIVQGIISAINYKDSLYEVFNLGNNQTVSLSEMVSTLEEIFEKKAIIKTLPEQDGDVPITYADITKACKLLNYSPKTTFRQGIINYKNWLL